MKLQKVHLALLIALVFYGGLCAFCVSRMLAENEGTYIYPLDDAYISMAMAKNLASYHVMGMTRDEFSASSSCPLWIVMLAAVYAITNTTWWAPLMLGLLAGAIALIAAYLALLRYSENAIAIGAALAAICFLTPLPALGLSGMEHTVHIALVLFFVPMVCRYLGKDSRFPSKDLYRLAALIAVMVMVRFESMFLGAIFCGLAVLRRRWRDAGIVAAATFIPVFLFGLLSVSHGWEWLPNSVLVKVTMPAMSSRFGLRIVNQLSANQHVLALIIALAELWVLKAIRGARFWEPAQLMLLMPLAATLVHLQFASVGWFFRYEGYLMAIGILALACAVFESAHGILAPGAFRRSPVLTGAVVLGLIAAALPMSIRGFAAIAACPEASHEVFQQQYQMGLFLNQYYNGESIAANDMGVVNFMNDLHCLDLTGLGNRDVYRLMRSRTYDTAAIDRLAAAAHVRIAVVYPRWFNGVTYPPVPDIWTLVGWWQVTDRQYLGGDTVGFYAVQPDHALPLARALHEFAPRMPKRVIQRLRPILRSGS